jgi:prevent-host-death family protein
MEIVSIHEAKTHLSRLVERAARGEEIVLAKSGKPVARLVPYVPEGAVRRPGAMRGKIRIKENFDTPFCKKLLHSFEASRKPCDYMCLFGGWPMTASWRSIRVISLSITGNRP